MNKPVKDSEIHWPEFVRLARMLVGKPYVFGAETDLGDPDPAHIQALDCSELVEWLYAQIGLVMPDGSYNQFKATVPVTGVPRAGDLGFKWVVETQTIHHVAVCIGDVLVEAKGKSWGTIYTPIEAFQANPEFAGWRRHKGVLDA